MQRVKFVVDKQIDITNHINTLNGYKRRLQAGVQQKNKENEQFLKLSPKKQREWVENNIGKYYEKRKQLNSLAADINKEWAKIESKFIKRLERIHKRPFKFKPIKGALSSAQRFGYSTYGNWFAAKMFSNKFIVMDAAMHELMHFMFHKYYWKECQERGLPENKIWDIKESFTILLDLEFGDLMFDIDKGYPAHQHIRDAISKSWKKYHDFDKALAVAVKSVEL